MGRLSLSERLRRILWNPGVIYLLAEFFTLLWHIDNLAKFRIALQKDGFEAAAEHTSLTADELEHRAATLRRESKKFACALFGREK